MARGAGCRVRRCRGARDGVVLHGRTLGGGRVVRAMVIRSALCSVRGVGILRRDVVVGCGGRGYQGNERK